MISPAAKSPKTTRIAQMRASPGLKHFTMFGAVGVIGFAVDAIILFIAIAFAGAGPFSGRFISISAAMMTTWYLNRTLTFRVKSDNLVSEVARYAFAKAVGLLANLSIYSAIVLLTPDRAYPLFALIAASGASLVINFGLVRRFVFLDANR